MCLQELKATNTEFPGEATRQAGYHAVYRGESCGNGVAILARWTPVVTRMDLPGDDGDRAAISKRPLTARSSPRSTLPSETLSPALNLTTNSPG